MKNIKYLILSLILVSLLGMYACKKDRPEWDTEILLPLVNTTLSIENFAKDSMIFENTDSSVYLVYSYVLKEVDMNKILQIPDTTLTKTVTLKSIKIGTREFSQQITLGSVARKNGSMGQLLLNAHGSYYPIPAIAASSGGSTELDATSLFESIEVKEGSVTANIYNGFPIELNDLVISLKNKSSGTLILIDTIASISAKQSYSETYPLDGKHIEGILVAEVLNFSSPGTGLTPVLIDTNAAIDIQLSVNIESVSAARAIFPAQNLVDIEEDVLYHLDGPELDFMRIESGQFKIVVASTLEDSSYIYYSIPEAKYQGVDPLVVENTLPPAEPGDTVYKAEIYDIIDYWYDLTGKDKNTYNTFYHKMIMRIDSTGKMIDLSLDDSIYLFYTLYDVNPNYVHGYIGTDSFSYASTTEGIDVFEKVLKGNLAFEDVTLRFFVENQVGAEADVKVNKIVARNTSSGLTTDLNTDAFDNPIAVSRALDNPLKSAYFSIELDGSNSNAVDLINIMPDAFDYDLVVRLNPNGNTYNYNDFVYNSSRIKAGVEIELPLSLTAEGLQLADTVVMNIGDEITLDRMKNGSFMIRANNKFPIAADLQIYMMNEFGQTIDSFFRTTVKVAPGIAGSQGKVLSPVESEIHVELEQSQLENFMDAGKLVIISTFNTIPENEKIKIFSDYYLNVKIMADFSYQVQF